MDCVNRMIISSLFLVFRRIGKIGTTCAEMTKSLRQFTPGDREINEFKILIELTE